MKIHRKWLFFVIVGGSLAALGYAAIRSVARSTERTEAIQLADQGKYSEAIPKLKNALEHDPNDVEVLQRLVDAMANNPASTIDDAMPYLNRWCELRKDDFRPYLKRMNGWLFLDQPDSALEDALIVLRLDQNQFDARCTAARLLRNAGRYDEAEAECKILLTVDSPIRLEILVLLAAVYNDKGEFANASNAVQEVLAEHPGHDAAQALQGVVLFNMGRFEEAVKSLEKAARSRDYVIRRTSLNKLAASLANLGRKGEAQQMFDRIKVHEDAIRAKEDADQRPDDWLIQIHAGKQLLKADFAEEGKNVLESALRRLPPNPVAFSVLGDCYEKLGEIDLANRCRIQSKKLRELLN